jgi:chromosome segregation ATPase
MPSKQPPPQNVPKEAPPQVPPPTEPSPNPEPVFVAGLPQEYFDRVKEESVAFDNLRTIESGLSDDLRGLRQQIDQEIKLGAKEGQDERLKGLLTNVSDRLDGYQKQVEKYQSIEIRGPWDVSNDVHTALDALGGRLNSATKELGTLRKQYNDFAGENSGNPKLQDAKGTLASWMRETTSLVDTRTKNLRDVLISYQTELRSEIKHHGDVLMDLTTQIEHLIGRKHVSQQDIADLTATITKYDDRSTEYRTELLTMIQEKIDAATNFKPTEEKLEQLNKELHEIAKQLNDADVGMGAMKNSLDQLAQRPVIDNKLMQDIHDKLGDVDKLPSFFPVFEKLTNAMETLNGQHDDFRGTLQLIREHLEEIKNQDHPTMLELKGSIKHMEQVLGDMENRPSSEYNEVLQNLHSTLEKVTAGHEDDKARFEALQQSLDSLGKNPQGDDSAALIEIEKSLDILKNRPVGIDYTQAINDLAKGLEDKLQEHQNHANLHSEDVMARLEEIKARPALNSDFAQLKADVHTLTEAIPKSDNSGLIIQVQELDKLLNERPGLNINRDELFDRLKSIQTGVEAVHPVNEQAIFDMLHAISKKTETIDMPGVFNDLNQMSTEVHGIATKPVVSPNDMREMIQGLHNNIDEVKKAPLLNSNKPLLTQEHYDRSMGPLAVTIHDLGEHTERGKAILDVVQDVHHGVLESNRRPAFDVRPINGLSKQMESYHNDQSQKYDAIESKLDNLGVDDGTMGSQMNQMRNEFKTALEDDRSQRQAHEVQIKQKIDFLTKVAAGTAIASGVTLLGFLGWKLVKGLFGKKKEADNKKAARAQAVNKAKVGKRLHPRAWRSGAVIYTQSEWHGNNPLEA